MKLNQNKKSVKISLNLFALYAVMVCGVVFALPAFARWWWSRTSPRSSFH